jgi:hypothetical protein
MEIDDTQRWKMSLIVASVLLRAEADLRAVDDLTLADNQ